MYSPIKAYALLKTNNEAINVEYVTTYKKYYLFQDNDYKLEAGKNMSLRTMIQPMIRVNMYDGKISVFKKLSPFMMLKTSSEIEAQVLKDHLYFNDAWIHDDYALRQYANASIGKSLNLFNNINGTPAEETQKLKIVKSYQSTVDKMTINKPYICLLNFIDVINKTLKINNINQDLQTASIEDFQALDPAIKDEITILVDNLYDLSRMIIKTE